MASRSSTPTARYAPTGFYDEGDSVATAASTVLSRQDSYVPFSRNPRAPTPTPSSAVTQQHQQTSSKDARPTSPNRRTVRPGPDRPEHPSHSGRVKVGIRCRPAFDDEVAFAKGTFFPIVETSDGQEGQAGNVAQGAAGGAARPLCRVSLTLLSGRQRDFVFDHAFGAGSSQDAVFDKIARPVVADVLQGYNGTIFAYGQTGTGKTYTMGILEFVNSEHAGIIPRALAQIFGYASTTGTEISISMSFLQLYRETIQGEG